MSITSVEFFGFVVLAVMLYYIVPLCFRWISLLICSAFYLYTANDIKLLLHIWLDWYWKRRKTK